MVDVAEEMERRGFEVPLLIGGATTSRQHTAVRIAPAYSHETVHVLDASRVIDVVSALLDPDAPRDARRARTASCRSGCASSTPRSSSGRCCRSTRRARNREQVDFDDLPAPPFTGARVVEPELAELVPFIDWQFFFHAWDLKGKFPAILEQPGGARALRRRAGRARRDRARRLAAGARRLRLLARACRGRRRRRRRDALLLPAPAGGPTRRPAEPLPCRLRSARRTITLGAFAVGDPRCRRARRRGFQARARRLPRHHRQGARRPARRGLRRVAAPSARAASGTRPTSSSLGDDAAARALPRHQARVRLPGVPRSQREGRSSSSCSARATRGSS